MSTSALKQLFLVAFLGLTLVGCSSTPATEEGGDSASASSAEGKDAASDEGAEGKDEASDEGAEGKDAGVGANMAESSAAAAKNASGMTADEILAMIQGKVVSFDFDRAEVKSDFYELIKMHADYMALNTSATLTIQGHCDERGTKEYNLALGERRANAVKNALIAEGVSPGRINTISFGEENPVDVAHNEMAWAKNRRAEFVY